MSKQKQFSGQKSYKMRESTLYCIGNSERNMDLSVIYLAVQLNYQHIFCHCVFLVYDFSLINHYFSKKLNFFRHFKRIPIWDLDMNLGCKEGFSLHASVVRGIMHYLWQKHNQFVGILTGFSKICIRVFSRFEFQLGHSNKITFLKLKVS